MLIDVPDEYIPLIVRALETQYAYTKAKQADDIRYQEAADLFKEENCQRGICGAGRKSAERE